eukprot:95045-Lingulodinium_polyedra.AAC.1
MAATIKWRWSGRQGVQDVSGWRGAVDHTHQIRKGIKTRGIHGRVFSAVTTICWTRCASSGRHQGPRPEKPLLAMFGPRLAERAAQSVEELLR